MSKFQPNYFVVFFGAIFLAVGLYQMAPNVTKALQWKPAQGKVVGTYKSLSVDAGGQPDYAPIIDFTAADGQTYRFTSDMNTGTPSKNGATEPVLYDPTQPANAIEDNWLFICGLPGIFVGVGLVIILAGLVFGNKFE